MEGGETPLPLLSMDENRRDSRQPDPNTPIFIEYHGCPYEGLSRMKGNVQVRFLEGAGR